MNISYTLIRTRTSAYQGGDKKCLFFGEFDLFCFLGTPVLEKKTLWPLFMNGVQLPQGYSHFDEAVYFLPLSFEIRPFALLATIYKIKHIKGMYGYK